MGLPMDRSPRGAFEVLQRVEPEASLQRYPNKLFRPLPRGQGVYEPTVRAGGWFFKIPQNPLTGNAGSLGVTLVPLITHPT